MTDILIGIALFVVILALVGLVVKILYPDGDALERYNRQHPPGSEDEPEYDIGEMVLGMQAGNSPRSAALYEEYMRGKRRRELDDFEDDLRWDEPAPEEDLSPLHAHEITPADAMIIRAMSGATFGPDSRVQLPSGKWITGTEMQKWVEDNDA